MAFNRLLLSRRFKTVFYFFKNGGFSQEGNGRLSDALSALCR